MLQQPTQVRIVYMAALILVFMTLLAAAVVYGVMQRNVEQLLSKSLQESLRNDRQLTEAEITTSFNNAVIAATRRSLAEQLQPLDPGITRATAQTALDRTAESFIPSGLVAMALLDAQGAVVATTGTVTANPALAVPLNLPGRVELMWGGRLLLRATLDINEKGQVLGKVLTEWALPGIEASLKDAKRLGSTGEMALCAPLGVEIQCFPTTLKPQVFVVPRVASDGGLLPMAYALDGKTGGVSDLDYRGQQVEAAYGPVANFGLGIVLKIDTADLLAPVWQQMRYLIPLIAAVLLLALLALRWLLTPLVRRLESSQKQAVQMSISLRNSEEHFRKLFETSMECILQTRPDGEVTNANAAACALFDLTVDQMRGLGRSALVDMTDPRLPALLEERKTKGQARGQLRMRRGDGSLFECELSSTIFLDVNGQTCATIMLRDITERVQEAQRIEQINAELEQRVRERTAQLEASGLELQEFTYSLAHDLRQPFIAIGGFTGLLERSVKDDQARHFIDRIKGGVNQAGKLTDSLLELATLSRVELRLQDVDLSALAESIMEDLQKKEPARVCRVDIEPGLRARADPTLIKNILSELLDNAWKFSSRKDRAEISFRQQSLTPDSQPAGGVYVVSDNGVGFDMAHADKLFRSFQRLHSSHEFPGTGADLAKIRRAVSRHGGRIWANSAPDNGASFYFTLDSRAPHNQPV